MCHLTIPQWDQGSGEGEGWSTLQEKGEGEGGYDALGFVTCGNCGLVPQVCIRKYKARQFVGSSNFQGPESSENYFSYPR